MKSLAGIILGLVLSGCIYAPRADVVAGQIHYQFATNMVINQEIPIKPQVAENLSGLTGVQGNVASGNTIASPSGGVKLK